jgi:hypothetical protein
VGSRRAAVSVTITCSQVRAASVLAVKHFVVRTTGFEGQGMPDRQIVVGFARNSFCEGEMAQSLTQVVDLGLFSRGVHHCGLDGKGHSIYLFRRSCVLAHVVGLSARCNARATCGLRCTEQALAIAWNLYP